MSDFHNVRIAEFVSLQAEGGPAFVTLINNHLSGQEKRKSVMSQARRRYYLKECYLSTEQYQELLAFFHARKGKYHSFRYLDYFDYKVNKVNLQHGRIDLHNFQLGKLYDDNFTPIYRPISLPIANSLEIFRNNEPMEDFILNEESGIVTFDFDIGEDEVIYANFEFDVRVRFNNDLITTYLDQQGKIIIKELELVEVLP